MVLTPFWIFLMRFILDLFVLYILSCILVSIYRKLASINPVAVKIYSIFLIITFFFILIAYYPKPSEQHFAFSQFERCRTTALQYCSVCKMKGDPTQCKVKFNTERDANICSGFLSEFLPNVYKYKNGSSIIVNCTKLLPK